MRLRCGISPDIPRMHRLRCTVAPSIHPHVPYMSSTEEGLRDLLRRIKEANLDVVKTFLQEIQKNTRAWLGQPVSFWKPPIFSFPCRARISPSF